MLSFDFCLGSALSTFLLNPFHPGIFTVIHRWILLSHAQHGYTSGTEAMTILCKDDKNENTLGEWDIVCLIE